MKKISILVCCYNEQNNVQPLVYAIICEMEKLPQYDYEIIFSDNASTDKTQEKLKSLAKSNEKIKIIINNRNYGTRRSPKNAWRHVSGDAVLGIAADFQDPPSLIPTFIEYWEKGYLLVYGKKLTSQEGKVEFFLRNLYYKVINIFSDISQYEHISGIALNDKKIIEQFLSMDEDENIRHLIAELGYEIKLIPYEQQRRKSGKSSYNIGRYFEFAINSLITTSTIPLRIATILGCIASFISFALGVLYLVYKLIYWDMFVAGTAPLIIGMFFLGSIQLFFIGLLGEYIGVILKKVRKTPPVIEKELINFNK